MGDGNAAAPSVRFSRSVVLVVTLLGIFALYLVLTPTTTVVRSASGIDNPPPEQRDRKSPLRTAASTLKRKFVTRPNSKASGSNDGGPKTRIFVSTDCRSFTNWQMQLFLSSAFYAGETADIIRLVSNCPTDSAFEKLTKQYSPYPRYSLYRTPDFSTMRVNGGDKKFVLLNKACVFDYWAQQNAALVAAEPDSFAVILDSDMIFTRPLRFNTGRSDDIIYRIQRRPRHLINDTVKSGVAIGQFYGLGETFLKFETAVEDVHSRVYSIKPDDASDYNVGPPLIFTLRDFASVAPHYCSFTRAIVSQAKGDDWLIEMYGFSLAAIHANVRFTPLENFMFSDPSADSYGEAQIDWVDPLTRDENPCATFPEQMLGHRPTFLHFCQGYDAPDFHWLWSKYRVSHDTMLDCAAPMFQQPNASLWTHLFDTHDEVTRKWQAKEIADYPKAKMIREKRVVFMLCNILPSLNRMLLEYKQHMCPTPFNSEQSIKQ